MLTDLGARSLRIVLLLLVAYIVVRVISRTVPRIVFRSLRVNDTSPREAMSRAVCLSTIVQVVVKAVFLIAVLLMLLAQLNYDITPLLAGAGIAGLALALASQHLVGDFVYGFIILIEDQFTVGDVIRTKDYSGVVEKMELRRTLLRNLEGAVISIPNSDLRVVQNLTKNWSRVALDVPVAYKEDVDYVVSVLRELGEELAQDPTFGSLILEPPQVLGVEELGEYSVTIKVLVKTQPLKQWEVARELRGRIKKVFAARGIEIRFAHQVHLVSPTTPAVRRAISICCSTLSTPSRSGRSNPKRPRQRTITPCRLGSSCAAS